MRREAAREKWRFRRRAVRSCYARAQAMCGAPSSRVQKEKRMCVRRQVCVVPR